MSKNILPYANHSIYMIEMPGNISNNSPVIDKCWQIHGKRLSTSDEREREKKKWQWSHLACLNIAHSYHFLECLIVITVINMQPNKGITEKRNDLIITTRHISAWFLLFLPGLFFSSLIRSFSHSSCDINRLLHLCECCLKFHVD